MVSSPQGYVFGMVSDSLIPMFDSLDSLFDSCIPLHGIYFDPQSAYKNGSAC